MPTLFIPLPRSSVIILFFVLVSSLFSPSFFPPLDLCPYVVSRSCHGYACCSRFAASSCVGVFFEGLVR